MGKILNKSPFSSEIQDLTDIQIEYILRRYAKDNPDELKLKEPTPQPILAARDWSSVLTGKDLEEYMNRFIPPYLRKNSDAK